MSIDDGENLDVVEVNLREVWDKETGEYIDSKIADDGQLGRAGVFIHPTEKPSIRFVAPTPEQHKEIMARKQEADAKGSWVKMEPILEVKEMADVKRSLDIGIIGVGGAGGHIAEAFAKMGYDTMVVNLTDKDYDHLKYVPNDENSRVQLIVGAGGAGKNPDVGAQAVKEYSNMLTKKISRKFNNKEFIFVAAGLGGGTGTIGGRLVAEIAASMNIPVGMIITLPRKNEGTDEKINCLRGLQEVANYRGIKSIVVIDNQKVVERLKDTKDSDFWATTNDEIVHLFDAFNIWSAIPSNTAFDAEDYKKCLMTSGFLVLGESQVANAMVNANSTEAELARAIADIDKGYLATGFDHSTAVRAAGLIIKPNDLDYSHSFEETLFNHMKSEIGAGGLNRGIYLNTNQSGAVVVHTMLAGMKLPEARVQQLVSEAKAEASEMTAKIKERETQTFDLGLNVDFNSVSGNGNSNTNTGLGRRK